MYLPANATLYTMIIRDSQDIVPDTNKTLFIEFISIAGGSATFRFDFVSPVKVHFFVISGNQKVNLIVRKGERLSIDLNQGITAYLSGYEVQA